MQSANEFKQVGKSLNLFWLPADAVPEQRNKPQAFRFRGRIDENFDYAPAIGSSAVDLRDVSTITSRGLIRWIEFVRAKKGQGLELIALPEALTFQATAVIGVIEGVTVKTVLVPFECPGCGFEERRELIPTEVLEIAGGRCPECAGDMRFAGLPAEYKAFLNALAASSKS